MKLIIRAILLQENEKKRLKFVNPEYYTEIINRLNPKYPISVEIKNEIPRRSDKQMRYLWGVVYPIISEYTGDTAEEVHALMKTLFAPVKIYEHKGIEVEVPKSTKTMTIQECSDFIEKIINHAGQDLQLEILSPCQAGYFCMKPTCQICAEEMKKLST